LKRKEEENIDKNDKNVGESYDFSLVMSTSVAVRQRNDKPSGRGK
jgi:hypothetical protein